MARIRTIKPEFWTSEQVMECSLQARLLFIGLWNFCDDHGRHRVAPKTIKAEIFPGDDVSSESIRGLLGELSTSGLVTLYEVDEAAYLQINGWKHQRIDKRQPARYPPPPETLSDGSATNPRPLPPEGSRVESKGGRGGEESAAAPVPGTKATGKKTIGKNTPENNTAVGPGGSVDPAARIIEMFDAERVTAFGEGQRRPWPVATDLDAARRIDSTVGGDDRRIRDVFRRVMARMKAKGQAPPGGLAYCVDAVSDAVTFDIPAVAKRGVPPGYDPESHRAGAAARALAADQHIVTRISEIPETIRSPSEKTELTSALARLRDAADHTNAIDKGSSGS